MILTSIAILTLFVVIAFSIEVAVGSTKITPLATITPEVRQPAPLVSIIVTALNEETNITQALQSLTQLDYDHLEIIAINDRSTDHTGELLDQFSRNHGMISVVHIDHLPPHWLGKQHALQAGADRAKGDFLLFTDADVKIEPSTLKRAIRRMQDRKLDHLTLLFGAELSGNLLNMVVIEFGVGLVGLLKPWQAADPQSQRAIGIGAFNLVRRQAYEQVGGHRQIAMSPIDDVMLGVLLKGHGYRQECLHGTPFIKVPWYPSLSEMIRGLEKNSFAALDYSMTKVAAVSLFMLIVAIWPYWALLITSGMTRLLNLAIVVCFFLLYGGAAHFAGLPKRSLIWLPVSAYIRLYVLLRAVFVTLRHGGIIWRGTFYPLTELKSRHISMGGSHHDNRNAP